MELLRPLSIIIVIHCLTLCRCDQDDSYYYNACAPFTCGNVTVSFPFSTSERFCGLPDHEIQCDHSSSIPTLSISGITYRVNDIHRLDCLISLSDTELTESLRSNDCNSLQPHFLPVANFTPFKLPWWGVTLNVSWCRSGYHPPVDLFQNYSGCGGNESLYVLNSSPKSNGVLPTSCTHAYLPVQEASLLKNNISHREDLLNVVGDGFPLQWKNVTDCWICEANGGRCGYNQSSDKFLCFCNDGCRGRGGRPNTSRSIPWKIIVATVVPSTIILLAGVMIFMKFRTRIFSISNDLNIRSISRSGNIEVEEFIRSYKSMLPTEYSYIDVKKITDGLKEKLGGGGYGKVFKGRLPNGQLVAAKILEKSKDNGRDFVSEVATIGTIHHVHIIKLLGFCCDGSRRVLIYEYMPRGSLGDLISKEEIRRTLGVPKMLEIAVGIALGIEYLHQGCDKRILHLDIKPHNVLLDNSFHPKLSDFGLAKSYSRKDSIVPLTAARGTVGYIAPEVFLRNFGGVSHKSDVYSYGMLLLEMVMGRKNADPVDENSSKDYFPNWIYDQLNQWRDMDIQDSVVEDDSTMLRKMVMVGLWCVQTNPVDRPSISRALGMLTGRVECIETPPKPFLFSPPKQQSENEISRAESGADGLTRTAESE